MFPTPYQEVIYKRTYSRWIEDQGRREDWEDTVSRYAYHFLPKVPFELRDEFHDTIGMLARLEVMPSMRALWTAGDALTLESVCGYNCAYTTARSLRKFAEVLYILMCGTGVTISVERQYTSQLPPVPSLLRPSFTPIVFEDSKRGWAEGYLEVLESIFERGRIPSWDLSRIRPKGERLRTFGGRASGPEPLDDLLRFTVATAKQAVGRRLHSDEVADLYCKIASVVVVGGVRRAAIGLLSNPSDRRMAAYKVGRFDKTHPWRSFCNISAVYTDKPDMRMFMSDYLDIVESGTGERGIINRDALRSSCEDRDPGPDCGVNPCGEIVLKPDEFCNLTEVVIREDDSFEDMVEKVKAAARLGVLQSTLTNFQFLGPEWKQHCEEERLLGVSLTGLRDRVDISDLALAMLRDSARIEADRWADAIGINRPRAATCVKPSGTVSQLVNSASGLHVRWSQFYIRRVRVAAMDPVCKFLMDQGVPYAPENGQTMEDANTFVFAFPVESPDGCVTRKDVSAIDQLEYWKLLKVNWCDHNPSVTIYVKPEEWLEVGTWIYRNWEFIGGITLMPYDNGVYQQPVYEEIDESTFEQLYADLPLLDWNQLNKYERGDTTTGAQEYACQGGACEIV